MHIACYMVSLIFRLTFICPPQALPPSYHSSSRSSLPTVYITESSPRLTKSFEIQPHPLHLCKHISHYSPKVHTIAVRSVFSLYPQKMLTHDAYYPLEILFLHPFAYQNFFFVPLPIKTFKNQFNSPFSMTHSVVTTESTSSGYHHICLCPTLHRTNFS